MKVYMYLDYEKKEIITRIFTSPDIAIIKINNKSKPSTWGQAKYWFDKASNNLNLDPDYYKTIGWDEWNAFMEGNRPDDEIWLFKLEPNNNFVPYSEGFFRVRNDEPVNYLNLSEIDN